MFSKHLLRYIIFSGFIKLLKDMKKMMPGIGPVGGMSKNKSL